MPYLRTLPVAAVQEVISYFAKAPGVTLQSVIEDAYDVLGFALYTFEGSSRPAIVQCDPDCSDEEKIRALQSLLPSNKTEAITIPWALIWSIIEGLITQWISTLPKA